VFDPAKVAFFGHSQGSTSGEIAMRVVGAAGAGACSRARART
jgi:hypothetical protein